VSDQPADEGVSADFRDHAPDTAAVWDTLAEWWDDAIGGGNATQDLLVEPAQERLLELRAGQEVARHRLRRWPLHAPHGRARRARGRVRSLGAVHRPRPAAHGAGARGAYRLQRPQRGRPDGLLDLGERRFHAAVCTMALMDMARITPLLSTLPRLLVENGRFVFSITHPAFNSGDARIVGERVRRGSTFVTEVSISVTDYLTPRMQRDVGVPGQPVEQHYFHRPLALLLNAAFDQGFVLDRLEEPGFPPSDEPPARRRLAWSGIDRLPQVLVARLRPWGASSDAA
jgi:hypothetical protein